MIRKSSSLLQPIVLLWSTGIILWSFTHESVEYEKSESDQSVILQPSKFELEEILTMQNQSVV